MDSRVHYSTQKARESSSARHQRKSSARLLWLQSLFGDGHHILHQDSSSDSGRGVAEEKEVRRLHNKYAGQPVTWGTMHNLEGGGRDW